MVSGGFCRIYSPEATFIGSRRLVLANNSMTCSKAGPGPQTREIIAKPASSEIRLFEQLFRGSYIQYIMYFFFPTLWSRDSCQSVVTIVTEMSLLPALEKGS